MCLRKYRTQLGNLFMRGRELSGGQWQKVALSRALMREEADALVRFKGSLMTCSGATEVFFSLFFSPCLTFVRNILRREQLSPFEYKGSSCVSESLCVCVCV